MTVYICVCICLRSRALLGLSPLCSSFTRPPPIPPRALAPFAPDSATLVITMIKQCYRESYPRAPQCRCSRVAVAVVIVNGRKTVTVLVMVIAGGCARGG